MLNYNTKRCFCYPIPVPCIDLFHLPTLMHNSFIHEQYVCYITILDMFRVSTRPSSGGKIVLSQHLVSSLSVQPFTEIDDTRCCDNTICSPEYGHVDARNMSRIVM